MKMNSSSFLLETIGNSQRHGSITNNNAIGARVLERHCNSPEGAAVDIVGGASATPAQPVQAGHLQPL